MSIETFWTIVCYAVLLGIGALGGFVFYYWFVMIPDKYAGQHVRASRSSYLATRTLIQHPHRYAERLS